MVPIDCDLSETALLVVYPELEISTAQAYASTNWGICPPNLLTTPDLDNTIRRFREMVERKGPGWEGLVNDFEGPAFDRYPALREAGNGLLEAGCRRVLLCGSGSALVGLAAVEKAVDIEKKASQKGIGTVRLCRPLSSSRYEEILREHGLQF